MRVIDLGANYGYYTLLMADIVGQAGFVYAIEANPELVTLLSDTLRINGMGSTSKVFSAAISDRVGKCWFLSDPKSPMNGHLVMDPVTSTDPNTFDVEIVTLDTLIPDGEHIDFLKIDIEGAEEVFFNGASRTLANNQNITIVCEVNAARYSNPIEFFSKLRGFGFGFREIAQDGSIVPVTDDQLISSAGDHMLVLDRS
jgi:FkbM family methyltransferase